MPISVNKKKKKFVALTIFLVLLMCIVMAEIGIRIYHATCDRERFIWLPDEFLAYIHSGSNVFQHHFTEGKRITVDHRTNKFGFLGNDISLKKDADTFRVLVLGDSFSEALQVSAGHNFCGRLQNLLSQSGIGNYKKVEVINTGVSGYSLLNYYLYS